MIKDTNKQDCCGCMACVQRCPKHCISMKEDKEGFLYPVVNENICIDCGLCEKVCPWLNHSKSISPIEVLAVKNRNEAERLASSSGGVFIALAKEVLSQDGIVFGAIFDENWEVKHTYADTLEDVKPMMGSKYLQSRMGNCYQEAEKFLKEGRQVLFTGTPCQITGLHRFLRKAYPNLLSVDFLCHGVPSPGVWRKYLNEEFTLSTQRMVDEKENILSSALNTTIPIITSIEFRDKKLNGWKQSNFVVRGKFSSKEDRNSILLSNIHHMNPFMRGFLANVYLRPSCYYCKCKNGVSHSDLTIADFWGINRLMPDFDDDKGTGLVLINTEKGKNIFDCLNMESRKSNLSDVKPLNEGFNDQAFKHPKRNVFFESLDCGDSIKNAVEKILYVPIHKRIWTKIKNRIKRIIISVRF